MSDPRSIPHPLFSCALPFGFDFKVKGIGLELSRLEMVELYFIDIQVYSVQSYLMIASLNPASLAKITLIAIG